MDKGIAAWCFLSFFHSFADEVSGEGQIWEGNECYEKDKNENEKNPIWNGKYKLENTMFHDNIFC